MAIERKNVIAVRLTDEEYAPFQKVIEGCDISKSDFFRAVILSKKIDIPASKHITKEARADYKEILFYANKTSNNINQIAKRLNIEHNRGRVSEETFIKSMNALISIRDVFLSVLK